MHAQFVSLTPYISNHITPNHLGANYHKHHRQVMLDMIILDRMFYRYNDRCPYGPGLTIEFDPYTRFVANK